MASALHLLFSMTGLQVLNAALGALVCYCLLWIMYARTFHPLRNIPGPFLASISRLWVMWRIHKGDMEVVQRGLHERYGPLIRIAPHEVACADPEAIKKLYPTQAPLSKTDFYPVWANRDFTKHWDHFSNVDEKAHSERRRIVNNLYSLSNILQSEQYINQCSSLFMERLGEYADAGKVLDLGEWLQWYAFDVVGELFFGKMFGFMRDREDHESWIESMDTLMPVLCQVAVAPSYSRPLILMSSVLNPVVRRALSALNRIAAAAKSCVEVRIDGDVELAQARPRRDMMQQFLDLKREKGEKVDFTAGDIQLEIYTALFAGSDTTAIAMRSILYHLLKHPQVYARLQQEIDDATASGQLSSPPTYTESRELPLFGACVLEGFRLHPSVGLTMPRIMPKEGLTLCGRFIPAGYRVGMNGAVVHYDKSIFGSDADRFNPDRWLTGDSKRMDKYMLHFGAGTRTCIGKNISVSEIYKLIPFMIQQFDLELENPSKDWTTDNKWFNKQTGLHVLVKRRA